ncbi:hypothetical protein T459_15661 [Capsicum annuum]|uniref:N-acetyltransferase domain-containing protein n=1 Tax=Capsicum annuum TaxID=4072 RepID=A0A2G2Z6K6_CAPAN|nr:hypothetical protein T459_15661 [Capsicum annuum]
MAQCQWQPNFHSSISTTLKEDVSWKCRGQQVSIRVMKRWQIVRCCSSSFRVSLTGREEVGSKNLFPSRMTEMVIEEQCCSSGRSTCFRVLSTRREEVVGSKNLFPLRMEEQCCRRSTCFRVSSTRREVVGLKNLLLSRMEMKEQCCSRRRNTCFRVSSTRRQEVGLKNLFPSRLEMKEQCCSSRSSTCFRVLSTRREEVGSKNLFPLPMTEMVIKEQCCSNSRCTCFRVSSIRREVVGPKNLFPSRVEIKEQCCSSSRNTCFRVSSTREEVVGSKNLFPSQTVIKEQCCRSTCFRVSSTRREEVGLKNLFPSRMTEMVIKEQCCSSGRSTCFRVSSTRREEVGSKNLFPLRVEIKEQFCSSRRSTSCTCFRASSTRREEAGLKNLFPSRMEIKEQCCSSSRSTCFRVSSIRREEVVGSKNLFPSRMEIKEQCCSSSRSTCFRVSSTRSEEVVGSKNLFPSRMEEQCCSNSRRNTCFRVPSTTREEVVGSKNLFPSRMVIKEQFPVSSTREEVAGRLKSQRRDHQYEVLNENGWTVRRITNETEMDIMREVAAVRAEAFCRRIPFSKYLFFQGEELSRLGSKLKNYPPERYACLVAEASSDIAEVEQDVVGVVDVTVYRDDDVLQHLPGATEYVYIAGVAVSNKFRRQKVATTLLKACDVLARVWGYEYLVLRAYEDDFGARHLYTNAGYKVVSSDALWKTKWIGRRRVLMVKQDSHESTRNKYFDSN